MQYQMWPTEGSWYPWELQLFDRVWQVSLQVYSARKEERQDRDINQEKETLGDRKIDRKLNTQNSKLNTIVTKVNLIN